MRWPGIDRKVEQRCRTCQQVATTRANEKDCNTLPWQDLAADLLGPLVTGDYLLVVVVVDYFSRFFEVTVTMSVTASNMTSCFWKTCLLPMDSLFP